MVRQVAERVINVWYENGTIVAPRTLDDFLQDPHDVGRRQEVEYLRFVRERLKHEIAGRIR
jgi:hypothetical protein